jgi:hypothetical protein
LPWSRLKTTSYISFLQTKHTTQNHHPQKHSLKDQPTSTQKKRPPTLKIKTPKCVFSSQNEEFETKKWNQQRATQHDLHGQIKQV